MENVEELGKQSLPTPGSCMHTHLMGTGYLVFTLTMFIKDFSEGTHEGGTEQYQWRSVGHTTLRGPIQARILP